MIIGGDVSSLRNSSLRLSCPDTSPSLDAIDRPLLLSSYRTFPKATYFCFPSSLVRDDKREKSLGLHTVGCLYIIFLLCVGRFRLESSRESKNEPCCVLDREGSVSGRASGIIEIVPCYVSSIGILLLDQISGAG